MLGLPKTATAPFCPSEVKGTVFVSPAIPTWQRALRFAGPGLLISVGYMDPGNWATDIQAGSEFGYALLFVVTGRDLAVLTRENYRRSASFAMWLLAELAIVATDLAEVLGSALAF